MRTEYKCRGYGREDYICLHWERSLTLEQKTAAAGFCFGGKYVARHLHPAEGKIDVGFTAHPSFITREELNAINGPLAIAAAETDHIFPDEKRHESETILRKVGLPWQLNVYSDVEHGFMSRGDLNSRQARFAKELAFLQAVQWFDEHLKD
jgi:dienelactone hydrolase